jgi:hypothetical protein
LQAFIHLTGFMIQPLMVFSFLLTCLTTLSRLNEPSTFRLSTLIPVSGNLLVAGNMPIVALQNLIWAILFPFIILCTLAPWISSLTTMKALNLSLTTNLPTLFGLLLLGFGLSLSNTLEAGKALFTNRNWEFSRTPKYADLQNKQDWRLRKYQIPLDLLWMPELVFILLGLWAIGTAVHNTNYSVLFILIPFTVGYGFVLLFSILQSKKGIA